MLVARRTECFTDAPFRAPVKTRNQPRFVDYNLIHSTSTEGGSFAYHP
jgi:hypothetical protein